MRHYELMVILDPSVDERNASATLEKMLQVVTENGGTVESIDNWGKRRLAYEINKKTEGVYAVIQMHTTPDVAKELERQLGINELVMRIKLLRPDAK